MNGIIENNLLKKRKKERIKISNLDDFKETLKKEGYKISAFDEEKLKEEIAEIFEIDNIIIESLYKYISEPEITYRADNSKALIDYIKKIMVFENHHSKLCEQISTIDKIIIDRIEYEREPRVQEDIGNMMKTIEETADEVSAVMSEEEKIRLIELEEEIDEEYLYSKDIELLKKMISIKNKGVKENYNEKTMIKTMFIEIPKKINYEYIRANKGSIEYHEYLNSNIPRMQRLIKNINKYMNVHEKEKATFKINQSKALQDSINIAVAIYDNKEFRAISGSNEIRNFCSAPPVEKAVFKSSKVNKLGKLGIGYNRINDSEKKIFEEIHKQIQDKKLKDEGNLVLYSKWEPCPSCYLVINQFCEKHPKIKVQVKYIKKYGE